MQLRQRFYGRGPTQGMTQGRVATVFLLLLGIVLLAFTLHHTAGPKLEHVTSQSGCQGATPKQGSLSLHHHHPPLVPPPGCLHLQDVCADQQSLVLYDPRYRPDAAEPVSLPIFQADWARYNFPFRTESNPDALGTEQLHLPPLSVRPVSSLEPTPDLQQPLFAADTVPLLFYPTWQESFGHTLHNSVGWLYTHLVKSNASWADMVRLVLYTPHGLAVKQHWHGLAAPVTPHPVLSFAEFSSRGSRCGRCFRDMLVCAGDAEDHATNSWQAAQHIMRHYLPTLPKPALTFHPPLDPSGAQPENSFGRQAGSDSSNAKAAPVVVLRVVFARRDGAKIRSITNLEELEAACRRWSHRDAATGRVFRAACGSWVFKDLLSSMAVAQGADVLIGIHGASIANSWFMRPGSSVVEVYPPAWLWDVHRRWLEQDPEAQLQWWGLLVKDPAAYSPGALELQMASMPWLYQGHQGPWKLQRDRNVRVPWAGIARILQEVAGAWGDVGAYRRAVGQGRQFWEATATNISSLERPPPAYLL